MDRHERRGPSECGGSAFATTHWSVVLQAANEGSPEAALALEKLCRSYWYPLYTFVRRRGYKPEDAQDLIQGFFLQLLEHKALGGLEPQKGRFRSWLMAGLSYYLADTRDKLQAQKRGGGQAQVPLDFQDAESQYGLMVANTLSPDKAYERHWALTLLGHVLARLEQEYRESGRARLFAALKPFLVEGGQAGTYAAAAAGLGVSEEVVKKSVQRLRHRYGRLFRDEIAQTVGNPAEVEDELQYLRQIVSQ